MLSLIIFFPAFGAILGFLIEEKNAKVYGACVAFIELLLTIFLWSSVDFGSQQYYILNQFPLLPLLGINYIIGVDGISLFLVVLSAFMSFIAILALNMKNNTKPVVISVLFLLMTIMGVFLSLDGILFYTFWELSLFPMLYIVGAFGGQRKVYAAVKFFVYTFVGSVFLLVGLIFIAYLNYLQSGFWSFSLLDWYKLSLPLGTQFWLFCAFCIAFAIKTPVFPLHTWLPHLYTQSPTIAPVLSAVLLKMGTYGFIRFALPLFPDASVELLEIIAILAVIMVIYAALIAYVQDDIKRVLAYSSISHMGVVMLGIFSLNSIGISGALFFMISHAIVSGALFLLVGIICDKRQTSLISEFGGLMQVMPRYGMIFGVVMMASVGLPLTIGFVGEFLSLLGMFQTNPIFAFLGGIGIIVGAIYMLKLFRKVFFGNCQNPKNLELTDLKVKEVAIFVPVVVLVILLGIYPNILLKPIDLSVSNITKQMSAKATLDSTKQRLKNINTEAKK